MSIAWIYLDKKSASAEAIKDFDSMKLIISSYPAELEGARADLTACHSSVLSGLPKEMNPHSVEAWLAAGIDEIDVMRERYRQALEFMAWFRPGWDALKDDERFVLSEFYRSDNDRQHDSIGAISNYFHIERSSAYNKKNRALSRLALHLYGK